MKTKKFKLNKTTIANLSDLSLKGIKGGLTTQTRPAQCKTENLRVCESRNTWCNCNLSDLTDCECNTIQVTVCATNCYTCPGYC